MWNCHSDALADVPGVALGVDLPILNTLYVSRFASQKVLSFIRKTNKKKMNEGQRNSQFVRLQGQTNLRCVTTIVSVKLFLTILIGLTRSEKTSVMCTPKRPGAHIWPTRWQIYPPPHRSAISQILTLRSQADQVVDLPPGKQQFYIPTDRFPLWHLRQTRWQIYPPKMAIWDCYW